MAKKRPANELEHERHRRRCVGGPVRYVHSMCPVLRPPLAWEDGVQAGWKIGGFIGEKRSASACMFFISRSTWKPASMCLRFSPLLNLQRRQGEMRGPAWSGMDFSLIVILSPLPRCEMCDEQVKRAQ